MSPTHHLRGSGSEGTTGDGREPRAVEVSAGERRPVEAIGVAR